MGQGALFTTASGRRWQRSEAARTVRRLARRVGIDGRICPHSLRHAFATIALDAGVSLHSLQDSMGFADHQAVRPGAEQPAEVRRLRRRKGAGIEPVSISYR
ncbi:tyrosine-type recombinase/integrase [Arthrobacter sp. ISL-85]|uniref:tyrosine-type recombinase/integrase n=1 Tax=Arthrobacter sp. ISL-85 TaxID=2819115 RepID=UPI001BEC9670|nr:tyrosine-type recombinase/integrase [Arthrobacter sp. ISL-85]